MASVSSHTFDHVTLGPLKGRIIHDTSSPSNEVIHFRSIPYATIPARFRQSDLLTTIPDTFDERPKADFSIFGYACPQIPQKSEGYGGKLEGEEERRYDEFACLNLTVAVPKSVLEARERGEDVKVPVMVYVHGGGFANGAGHVSALHDTTRMAALSVKDQAPVIMVNIGYRLNWFGFLACQDLLEEAESSPATPASPFNLGLYDQRNAFLWLHQQIAGFGGDPAGITAFGESAGATSLALHLCCDIPLFKRVILQSGQVGTVPSPPLADREQTYQRLLTHLNITAPDSAARLAALRQIPSQTLIDAIPHVTDTFFSPYAADPSPHGFFAGTQPTYHTSPTLIKNCPWITAIMLGDTQLEGEVTAAILRHASQRAFAASFTSALGPDSARTLLEAYEIPADGSTKQDQNLFWHHAMQLIGDVMFGEPTECIANALALSQTKKIYRYFNCLSNPFPGTNLVWHAGQHCIEMEFLFLTCTSRYPSWRDNFLLRTALGTARRWLAFGRGDAPWEEYRGERIAVCDDLRGWEVRSCEEDERVSLGDPWGPRRYAGRRVIREVLETVARMAGNGDGRAVAGKVENARMVMLDFKAYAGRALLEDSATPTA